MDESDSDRRANMPWADRFLFLLMVISMLLAVAAWTFHYATRLS